MLKRSLSVFVFCAGALSISAQEKKVYEWEKNPSQHNIPSTYSKESAVIITNELTLEIRKEPGNIFVYRSVHRIVKVQDEKGIEMFNKVNIPNTNGQNIEFIKARTILPSGKIVEVGRDRVKETKSESGSPEYLFAMEGVEKNSEIELLYTEKKPFVLCGAETFQFNVPVMNAEFSLSTPASIKFEAKGYNGFPNAKDSLKVDTRYYTVTKTSIPALHEEAYSDYEANQMREEYKLSFLPDEDPGVRKVSWKDFAKSLHSNYDIFTKKENAAANKYIQTLDVKADDEEKEKIRKIEEGIKADITINNSLTDVSSEHVDWILSNKTTTSGGYFHLFAACFNAAGVKYELGLTSNRFEHPFDESFENPIYYGDHIFYFPKSQQFLAPNVYYTRYPIMPAYMITNKAVFDKENKDDDVSASYTTADIREITPMQYTESQNNLDADITFIGDELTPQINVVHSFSGYTALAMRQNIVLLSKEKQQDFVYNIVNLSDKKEDVLTYKVSNSAFHNFYNNKPLKITANVKANALMEKAGQKYLFKIGDVIGKQSDLYQTHTRQSPISLSYPHEFNRTITVTIPEGYKIMNAETIKINVDDKTADKKATLGFHSDYKIEGNKLTVTINEFYSETNYPISFYPTFAKVINAAADFNKVVLVMAKK